MGLFDKLQTTNLEEQKDSLGGSNLLETDIYHATVKAAYVGYAKSGAMNVNLVLDIAGREYRETIYVTNRNGDNYWTRDGKKYPLPGFSTINDLCILTNEKPLSDMDTEPRVFKVWDSELKAEVNKEVPCIVDLLGKEVNVGIVHKVQNRTALAPSGKYEPVNEKRASNEINKFYYHDDDNMLTVYEAMHQKTAEFAQKWLDKNKGKVMDTFKEVAEHGGSKPAGGSIEPKPKKSLFG